MELIALIGIGMTVITIGVALATLILNTQRNLRADMRAEFKGVIQDTHKLVTGPAIRKDRKDRVGPP